MIKISYNQKSNVSAIHILINDCWAEIPYDLATRLIDWDSIDYEPTRNSIKTAWDEWLEDKDLAHELRDRPDLAPEPPKPQPNWGGFNTQMVGDINYNRVANQSTNQRAITRLEALSIENTSNFEFYKIFWNQMVEGISIKPTFSEIQNWNNIAKINNMPFEFGSSGEMILHAAN